MHICPTAELAAAVEWGQRSNALSEVSLKPPDQAFETASPRFHVHYHPTDLRQELWMTSAPSSPIIRLWAGSEHRQHECESQDGYVVLLNFWATACGGCKLEIPWLIDLVSAHKKDSFIVVGISMDTSYEGSKSAEQAWSQVKPFIADHKLNYPILMGGRHAHHLLQSRSCSGDIPDRQAGPDRRNL